MRQAQDLSVLADPRRAGILRMIRDAPDGRVLVGDVAERLGLRQPTVSHHMRVLLDDGIVTRTPDGRRAWYALAPAHAARVSALLEPGDEPLAPSRDRAVADLARRYAGVYGAETVAEQFADSIEQLRGLGLDDATLLARAAAFTVGRLDIAADSASPEVLTVLFVCVQNAGRSQLAAAILRRLAGDRLVVATAGSNPASEVRPVVLQALTEIGIAAEGEFPKPLTDDVVRGADVIVTMGCGDACPVYPGRRYLDWEVDDPAGLPLPQVRAIRDDIDRRVQALVDELVG